MPLDRRFLLRGLFHGTAVSMALPLFDCFLDGNGQALAATGQRIPTRFGTYFWGCGLTKELYLPKSTGQNYETTPQLASLEPFRKKLNLISGMKAFAERAVRSLLVVEDNEVRRQDIVGLAGTGPDVRTIAVGTGQEALDALRTSRFDCVVVDLDLPEADGGG